MPIISSFYGIIIFIFWRDHAPPHFHAKYGDDEVVIEIESGKVTGKMPRRALIMVQQWRKIHQDELLQDWNLAEEKKALFAIEPLE